MDYDFKLELILRDFPIIRDKVYMKDGALTSDQFRQSRQLLISSVLIMDQIPK